MRPVKLPGLEIGRGRRRHLHFLARDPRVRSAVADASWLPELGGDLGPGGRPSNACRRGPIAARRGRGPGADGALARAYTPHRHVGPEVVQWSCGARSIANEPQRAPFGGRSWTTPPAARTLPWCALGDRESRRRRIHERIPPATCSWLGRAGGDDRAPSTAHRFSLGAVYSPETMQSSVPASDDLRASAAPVQGGVRDDPMSLRRPDRPSSGTEFAGRASTRRPCRRHGRGRCAPRRLCAARHEDWRRLGLLPTRRATRATWFTCARRLYELLILCWGPWASQSRSTTTRDQDCWMVVHGGGDRASCGTSTCRHRGLGKSLDGGPRFEGLLERSGQVAYIHDDIAPAPRRARRTPIGRPSPCTCTRAPIRRLPSTAPTRAGSPASRSRITPCAAGFWSTESRPEGGRLSRAPAPAAEGGRGSREHGNPFPTSPSDCNLLRDQ